MAMDSYEKEIEDLMWRDGNGFEWGHPLIWVGAPPAAS